MGIPLQNLVAIYGSKEREREKEKKKKKGKEEGGNRGRERELGQSLNQVSHSQTLYQTATLGKGLGVMSTPKPYSLQDHAAT